jgi:hypothetical protein
MNRISRFAATLAMSGGLGMAGLAFGAGQAQADTWCPGDYVFTGMPNWDMSVCHE